MKTSDAVYAMFLVDMENKKPNYCCCICKGMRKKLFKIIIAVYAKVMSLYTRRLLSLYTRVFLSLYMRRRLTQYMRALFLLIMQTKIQKFLNNKTLIVKFN